MANDSTKYQTATTTMMITTNDEATRLPPWLSPAVAVAAPAAAATTARAPVGEARLRR